MVNAPETDDFDCLEAKTQWQTWAERTLEGLSPQQRRRRTEELIAEAPILGPIWNRLSAQAKCLAGRADPASPAV